MHRIVALLDIDDAAKFEAGFRTRGELFRRQTIRSYHYKITDDNRVAVFGEVDDLDKYQEILASDETARAMAEDGVNRETVQLWVLDREFRP
jgi:hypothetical protein